MGKLPGGIAAPGAFAASPGRLDPPRLEDRRQRDRGFGQQRRGQGVSGGYRQFGCRLRAPAAPSCC
jgi:hypothetical protein